jgi:hypothetical protein
MRRRARRKNGAFSAVAKTVGITAAIVVGVPIALVLLVVANYKG